MRNANKYTYIRLFNLIKGIFLSFIFIFIPKNKNRIIFSSTGNLKYDHNSKYLFEYFLEKYPIYEIKYVINDEELKQKLEKEIGNYFISTNNIKGILYSLFAYTWVVSSLETPVGGLFLRFNRLVVHLGHGTPLKNIGLLEKKISFLKKIYYFLIKENFSYVLSTSEEFLKIMANFLGIPLERVIVQGQPRNDSIFLRKEKFLEKEFLIRDESKNILYAPTWRPKKETKIFPFNDFEIESLEKFLRKENINIFLRAHPDFEDKIEGKFLKIKGIYILNSKKVVDISEYLSCFDLVITDYSSIFIDYLLLKKPVAFIPYDLKEYSTEIGFTVDYNLHTPGPKIKTYLEFQEEVQKLLNNKDYYKNEREKENKFYNCYLDNNNSERVANFIINKINNERRLYR